MPDNATAIRIVELSKQIREIGDKPAEVFSGEHSHAQSTMASLGYELAGLFLEALVQTKTNKEN